MASDPGSGSLFDRLKNKFASNNDDSPKQLLRKEIKDLHQQKAISDEEYSMLEGILAFQKKTAREVMVPRTDAFMIDANVVFQDNLDDILRQPYSRIPVYRQDKDRIIGIIHIRTILRQARQKGFAALDYQDVMTQPLFAPETESLSELLVQMQQTQRQLAILLDEYGGVVGLATIEDLIEEIVGDIDDEADQAQVLFRQLSKRHYLVYGKMPLTDFNQQFGTHLKLEDVDTIAGYMIARLGIIPAKGEKLQVKLDNDFLLTTGRMKGSRLLTILLTIPEQTKKEEETKN